MVTASQTLRQARSSLGSAGGIVGATIVLFAVSPLLAQNVLTRSSLLSMLPFAAILAIVAAGQTLVVQQGGIDLSVAGTVSMSAAVVTTYPAGDDRRLWLALVMVLAASALAGLGSGIAVVVAGLSPIVATLGMNALLLGLNVLITDGSPTTAPANLTDFSIGKLVGIPNTLIVVVVVIGVTLFAVKRTRFGRRFEAVGSNQAAARASGLAAGRYTVAGYVLASIFYGLAGVLLAGFVRIPGLTAGNEYLLPSIAAVVIGGTSLLGGAGNIAASGVGALFLTQLDQVTLVMGATTAVQNIIQAVIIALGMVVQLIPWGGLRRRRGDQTGRFDGPASGRTEPIPTGIAATDQQMHN